MRLNLVQMRMDPFESLDQRISRARALIEPLDGNLIVLPELWLHGAFDMSRFADEAQTLESSAAVQMIRYQAALKQTWIHGGSIITREDGKLFNTSIIVDPHGELAATYRKLHLFGFDQGEATLLSAGEKLLTLKVGEAVTGISTCYDVRFPEQYRALVDQGSELFVIPAGWPERRIEHWIILCKARAIENQCFVVAVNAVGPSGDVVLGGRSLVIDPWGEVIAEGGSDEQVITATIDISKVATTRESFPVLRDRKPIP